MKKLCIKPAKNAGINIQISNKVIFTAIKNKEKKKWSKFFQKTQNHTNSHPLQRVTKSYNVKIQNERNLKYFLAVKKISSWNRYFRKNKNIFEIYLSKLDVSCWLSGLCTSIVNARSLITAGQVTVNKNPILSGSYQLKEGDVICVKKSTRIFKQTKYQVIQKIPEHLEVSYSSSSFIFCIAPQKHYLFIPDIFSK